jgi:hypothetical protein
LGKPLTVARNHPLRPDGHSQEFNWTPGPEQHPYGKPRRAVAMRGGYDDYQHREKNLVRQ